MADVGLFAPAFEVKVNRATLGLDLVQHVRVVEVESADGIADMAKLTLANPDLDLTDLRAFAANAEIDVFMGYGTSLEHMGHYIVAKSDPFFSADEEPRLEVTAYTLDHVMMDNEPDPVAKPATVGVVGSRRQRKKKGKRVFPDSRPSEVAAIKAEEYGMDVDIDDSPDVRWSRTQKTGLNDYELVRGLANLTGFVFWVDGDEDGLFTLHFRDPEKLFSPSARRPVQTKRFEFFYRNGDDSTLLNFEPTFLMRGAKTKLIVQTKDPTTGKLLEAEVEDELQAPDLVFNPNQPEETVGESVPSASSVRAFFGDFSLDIVTSKKFATRRDLQEWAAQWFRRQRENFLSCRGDLIGEPSIRARQSHDLTILKKDGSASPLFSGRYFFTRVSHVMDADGGYSIDFSGRREIG